MAIINQFFILSLLCVPNKHAGPKKIWTGPKSFWTYKRTRHKTKSRENADLMNDFLELILTHILTVPRSVKFTRAEIIQSSDCQVG